MAIRIYTFWLKMSNLLKFGTGSMQNSVMTHYRGCTYANGRKYLKMTLNMVKHNNPVWDGTQQGNSFFRAKPYKFCSSTFWYLTFYGASQFYL